MNDHKTIRRGTRILGTSVALAALSAFAPALAGAAPTPASTAAAPSTSAGSGASALSQGETLAAPSVVLIDYQVSATAQDVTTGAIYNSLDGSGPLSTEWIGTGFFVSSDGFIVTAGHVAAPTPDDIKQSILSELFSEAIQSGGCNSCGPDPDQDAAGAASSFSLSNVSTKITVFTQNMDMADHPAGLAAALVQSSPVTENDTAVIKVQGSNFPVLPVADSSTVKVGDPVGVIGYPSTAIDNVDLSTLTSPTITSGTITNEPKQNGFDRLQSDATAEHGNSGGPLVSAAGAVVGIVSNGPTSTTNFYIPSNAVKDVMKQAGVDNSAGQIDTLWRNGLAAFNGHHYRAAAAVFDQCVSLNPVQVGCATYKTTATADFAQDVPVAAASSTVPVAHLGSKSSSKLPLIGGVLAAVLLALAAVVVAGRRRRPAGMAPTGPAPVTPAPVSPAWTYAQPTTQPAPSQQPVTYTEPVWTAPTTTPYFGAPGYAPQPQGPKFCADCATPMAGLTHCPRCAYTTIG